jgi:hypothetical protein
MGTNTLMPGPHIPITTSAGHYLSMQPAQIPLAPDKVWYRGDEYETLAAQCYKYKKACADVLRLFTDAPDPEILDILDIVERALK